VAEVVCLVAGRLHLCGVREAGDCGKDGQQWRRGTFYSRGERWALNAWWALTLAYALKRRLPAAGQSCCRCSYSAWEARRRASGDDEAVTQSLTGGYVVSHAPIRGSPSPPPPPPRGQGLDRVRRMKKHTPPDEIFVWRAQLGGIFCASARKWRLGGFSGGEWRCS
jgi:hypothetical protein